eukprot:maker-scaffold7522_size3139-snap-gene-0.0 protein:Tk10945 transcript:maker-scaffold7522_size3139-snap-gene-0.0-mRNA-1 annotation:"PREDICTED: uncharacterized protein K02A2.6-like"
MESGLVKFWNFRSHLSVKDDLILKGPSLFITKSKRKEVLTDLHSSHQGREGTKRRARQIMFWPYMNNEIVTLVNNCNLCRKNLKPPFYECESRSIPLCWVQLYGYGGPLV